MKLEWWFFYFPTNNHFQSTLNNQCEMELTPAVMSEALEVMLDELYKKYSSRVSRDHLRVIVDEAIDANFAIESGHYVTIRIGLEVASKLFGEWKWHEFRRMLHHFLDVAHKYHWTLAVVPASQYAIWNEDIRKFLKTQRDIYAARVPEQEIDFIVDITYTATDRINGNEVSIRRKYHGANEVGTDFRRQAAFKLYRMRNDKPNDNEQHEAPSVSA